MSVANLFLGATGGLGQIATIRQMESEQWNYLNEIVVTRKGLDLTNGTGFYPIFTIPVGFDFIVLSTSFNVTTSTVSTIDGAVSIGTGAGANNINASMASDFDCAVGSNYSYTQGAVPSHTATSGEVLSLAVQTAVTATAYIADVAICGILLPQGEL
ncbi:hypothetical protein [Clostridium sp.]|uniref:hypothetical protein n=1 Tax=Clostridium sp. TaxID=1506 RepID=UPI0028511311|nr:hypothetical protein [Clostridium sp.]MDR3598175.1 hypothetical protein [Clostridium sp.]